MAEEKFILLRTYLFTENSDWGTASFFRRGSVRKIPAFFDLPLWVCTPSTTTSDLEVSPRIAAPLCPV